MKKLFLIFIFTSLCISINSCSSDDNKESTKSILGTWKLIEIYDDPGDGSGTWNSVEDGYTYTFNADGLFTSTRFSECNDGDYELTEDELILYFSCDAVGTQIEEITFDGDTIILIPSFLSCIEGCGWRFEKINL